MECPICLENVAQDALIGQVSPCLHSYHSQCIEQWAAQSNSCPTCRKLFHRVDVRRRLSNRVVSSFRVQDRIAENAAIDDIPSEFVIPPVSYSAPNAPESRIDAGVCIICSSAQISASEMFSCIACGGAFHSSCLGYRHEGYWFCPVCDYQMEQRVPEGGPGPRSPSLSGRASGPLPGQVPTQFPRSELSGQDLLRSLGHRTRPKPRTQTLRNYPGSQNSVLIDGTDEFSDDESPMQVTSSGRARVLSNGGVRLRRQAREMQQLSAEEVQSWQILESARQGMEACADQNVTAPSATKKKRRPPEREGARGQSRDLPSLKQGTSRIARLMSQIQSHSIKSGTADSPIEVPDPVEQESPEAAKKETCSSKAKRIEKQTPKKEQPGNTPPEAPKMAAPALTLEQKRLVQSHVRGLLRPHYQKANTTPIWSEQEYIAINKTLSRQIYKRILESGHELLLDANVHHLRDLCRLCWTEYQEQSQK